MKRQFTQLEGDFNLQEMPKLVLFLRKSTKEEDNCDILCLRSSIVRDKNFKNQKYKKLKKPWKTKFYLILSHTKHTFFISDPQIEPQAFRHTNCTF